MVGQFRRVGTALFPGDRQINCSLYEWKPGNFKKPTAFRIRFISPDEPGPRIFYIEDLLQLWMRGKSTRFLEKACQFGHRILEEFETSTASDREMYNLFEALFRNRQKGHVKV